MSLNEQRIKEIANHEFAQMSDVDIQIWLQGAITGWASEHTVLAFSPFQNFFPSVHDEVDSLAQIFRVLPGNKAEGKPYSIRDQFRRALTNIIATKALYLGDPDIWLFAFDLAREIELAECVGALIPILSDARFRQNAKDVGTPLFDAVLKMSFSFGATPDVVAFWNTALAYINEAPHLSTQLLIRLIKARPGDWADYALETNMEIALLDYCAKQLTINEVTCKKRFIRLQSQISACLSDKQYLSGVEKLKYRKLDFLIDIDRVKSFEYKYTEEVKSKILRTQPA